MKGYFLLLCGVFLTIHDVIGFSIISTGNQVRFLTSWKRGDVERSLGATTTKLPIPASAPPSTSSVPNLLSSLDANGDGKYSLIEIVEGSAAEVTEIIKHSPLITSLMDNFKKFLSGQTRTMSVIQLGKEFQTLISFSDIVIIAIGIISYKPLLLLLHRIRYSLLTRNKEENHLISYKDSLLGRLEQPIQLLFYFPIFLFIVDCIAILLQFIGFQFHIKGNLPQVSSIIAFNIITGSFVTRIKDWVLFKIRYYYWGGNQGKDVNRRDYVQEKTFDDLTSAVVWVVVVFSCLQTFSFQFGVGLNSIFALGGLGSASFVLALRSTMENFLGGLLLRLQDKFRVNEKITIPTSKEEGFVESIQWLSTKIRRDDDSTITVPNANFIQGEVINWSRTPFRLFKTTISIKESNISLLPEIISNLRRSLQEDEDIETKDRDLIVAAVGFNNGNILIEINARLKGNQDNLISSIKTRVVDKIALEIDSVFKRNNVTK